MDWRGFGRTLITCNKVCRSYCRGQCSLAACPLHTRWDWQHCDHRSGWPLPYAESRRSEDIRQSNPIKATMVTVATRSTMASHRSSAATTSTSTSRILWLRLSVRQVSWVQLRDVPRRQRRVQARRHVQGSIVVGLQWATVPSFPLSAFDRL